MNFTIKEGQSDRSNNLPPGMTYEERQELYAAIQGARHGVLSDHPYLHAIIRRYGREVRGTMPADSPMMKDICERTLENNNRTSVWY